MLFEIPDPVARKFKAAVPSGQRSHCVTGLLEIAVAGKQIEYQKVCQRVNRMKKLNAESAAWEKFDDTEDR